MIAVALWLLGVSGYALGDTAIAVAALCDGVCIFLGVIAVFAARVILRREERS